MTCSLRKAARYRVRDPQTGKLVPLFNPRIDHWSKHFAVTKQWRLVGRTAKARATIVALGMNHSPIVVIRKALVQLGYFSPAAK